MESSTAAPAKKRRRTTLLALPCDLVVNIVGLVAATSRHPFADLSSIEATCKAMYAATKEPEVLRRVKLIKEKRRWLNNRYVTLISNLAGVGNPEACFLYSLMHVFAPHSKQLGVALLEEATANGHKIAAYVLGIVLYGVDNTRDMAKRYIGQVVKADSDPRINPATKITNENCEPYAYLAMLDIVEMVGLGKIVRHLRQVLPKRRNIQCASRGCGSLEIPTYINVFCSEDCRIKYEYTRFGRLLDERLSIYKK